MDKKEKRIQKHEEHRVDRWSESIATNRTNFLRTGVYKYTVRCIMSIGDVHILSPVSSIQS